MMKTDPYLDGGKSYCVGCDIWKPKLDFHRDRSAKSGCRAICKRCRQAGIETYGQALDRRARSRPRQRVNVLANDVPLDGLAETPQINL